MQNMIKNMEMEIGKSYERVIKGVKEIKDDIGSIVKISYRDFERRLEALEERIKVIEKIVLP